MFYDKFVALCKEKGQTPSYVANKIGFSRSSITKWKNEGSNPNMKTLLSVANYFDVPVEYFDETKPNNFEQKEKPPTMDGRVFELVTICNRLTDENLLKVADYIRYLLSTQA